MQRLSEDLQVLIEGTAAKVDGDAFDGLVREGITNTAGYTDDPRYLEHVRWLATVVEVDNRASIYTYIKGPNPNEMVFIGSSGYLVNLVGSQGEVIAEAPWGATFKMSYIPTFHPEAAMEGLLHTYVLKTIYKDDWGRWMSGYTPIRNSKGEIVGALGADYRATYVQDVQKSIRDKIVLALVLTYAILFLFVYYISNTLTKPITHLTRSAVRIGEGDYEQDLSGLSKGRLRDEISTLANHFAVMVSKVYQREQNLRVQVDQLRIMVDQAKQQKQVSEIVGTDFFKDLQAKANKMRGRSKHVTGLTGMFESPIKPKQ
jgi:methyl-accepting chemotaxis protein